MPTLDSIAEQSVLSNQLHKQRYLCKFHLQVCALLSQMNQHEDAKGFGFKAGYLAKDIMLKCNELCKQFITEIQQRRMTMV